MNVEYHKYWSSNLNRDMEFMVYGHAGKPILVFPTKGGTFNEYRDFGMVDVLQPLIDAGRIQLFTVDSVDNESWCNEGISCGDRAWRHCQYDKYIVEEVVPFIVGRCGAGKIVAHGNSYGAYHSANIFFRHPDIFDTVIAISGPFHPRYCIGDYMDDNVYFNAPLAFLPGLEDPWYLEQYRKSNIVVCVGQGYWEDKFLADTLELKGILEQKQIPAWIDIWGHDVAHDWPWWRQMVPNVMKTLFGEPVGQKAEKTVAAATPKKKAPAVKAPEKKSTTAKTPEKKVVAVKQPKKKPATVKAPEKKTAPKNKATGSSVSTQRR